MLDASSMPNQVVDTITWRLLARAQLILFDAVGTLLEPIQPVPEIYAAVATRWGSSLRFEQIAQRWSVALQRYAPRGRWARVYGPCRPPLQAILPTDETQEMARWRRIVTYVIDDLVGPAARGCFDELWHFFADARNWTLNPALVEVWQRLRRDGKRVGIASNYDQRLIAICRARPPLDTADFVFTSAQIGYPKPHPQFYRHIERHTGYRGTQLAILGDDPVSDVALPRKCGWLAFWWDVSCGKLSLDYRLT